MKTNRAATRALLLLLIAAFAAGCVTETIPDDEPPPPPRKRSQPSMLNPLNWFNHPKKPVFQPAQPVTGEGSTESNSNAWHTTTTTMVPE